MSTAETKLGREQGTVETMSEVGGCFKFLFCEVASGAITVLEELGRFVTRADAVQPQDNVDG